jgi:hypothetical protein
MGILKNIKDGWLNYFEAAKPHGNVDPKVEEVALERAAVCRECPSLVESGFFQFINKIVENNKGERVHQKTRQMIHPSHTDKMKDPKTVRGFKCAECGCGFPQNVYAPDKKCPLDKWER